MFWVVDSCCLQAGTLGSCMNTLWTKVPKAIDAQCVEKSALTEATWGSMLRTSTSMDLLSMIASTAPKPSQAATSWTITSVEAIRAMCNIFGWWLHKCDHCWLQVTSSCTNTLWRTDPRCTAVLSVARLAETGATWGSTWKTFTFPEVSLIVANTARRPSPLEPILTTMWPTYTKMPKSVIDEYTNGLLNWRFGFLWIRPKVPCLQAGTSSCMSILWRIPREARTATNAQFVGKLAMIEATWENTWKMLILTGSFHMSANIALQSLGHAPNLITMSQQHTKASIHLLEIHFNQRAKGFFMPALPGDKQLYDYIEKAPECGPRGHRCTLCGKTGNDRGNLRKHVENVHFPGTFSYQCRHCPTPAAIFPTRTKLNNHMSAMHKILPF